ncbi:MAG: hypothetical protein OXG16_13040 [Rhodospirillales bacterium]|nr:hypothetical protein [Rhodospirillales bacterium]
MAPGTSAIRRTARPSLLATLGTAFWAPLREPLRSTLPAVFDGVEVPKPDPSEILYEDGRELV